MNAENQIQNRGKISTSPPSGGQVDTKPQSAAIPSEPEFGAEVKHVATGYTAGEDRTILDETRDRIPMIQAFLETAWPEHREFVERCVPLAVAISEKLFAGAAPIVPVVVTATSPYGGAIGYCSLSSKATGADPDRASLIWLKAKEVRDDAWAQVLLHELLHASLSWRALNTDHNDIPWCDEIRRVNHLFGIEKRVKPIRLKRVEGKVRRYVEPGHLTQRQLARWPHDGHGPSNEQIRALL